MTEWLSQNWLQFIKCWERQLKFIPPYTKSFKVLLSLLGGDSKIGIWVGGVDVQQELALIFFTLLRRLTFSGGLSQRNYNIFKYHFTLMLADKIRGFRPTEFLPLLDEPSVEDIFPIISNLSYLDKYFIDLRFRYSLKEIADITKLTYKQIIYEDAKIWTKIQENLLWKDN